MVMGMHFFSPANVTRHTIPSSTSHTPPRQT